MNKLDKKTRDHLRDIFNKYNIAGLPIWKDVNYDEYDSEIDHLITNLDMVHNSSDLENLLVAIFDKMFWKGITKRKDMISLTKEVFDILKDANLI